jgi:hypothetical protein
MSCVALAPTRAAKPGAAARHAEVALRYAWGETHGRVYAPHRLVIVNRVRELRLFLSHRYGDTLPDDDAGRDDLELLLNYVAPGYGVPAMIAEARAWAPWLSCKDARTLAKRIAGRRKLKADTIARRIGCTYAERTEPQEHWLLRPQPRPAKGRSPTPWQGRASRRRRLGGRSLLRGWCLRTQCRMK